jgi:peptidoglycan/LPS O-acetylase OafA/YrhL
MTILKAIFILLISLSIGGIGGIACIIARRYKPAIRYSVFAGVFAVLTGIVCFASSHSILWIWGLAIGFIVGIFTMSLCMVSGESDKAMETES